MVRGTRLWFAMALIAVPFSGAQAAPSVPVPKVEAAVRADMTLQRISGVAVAVMKHGQVVFAKGFGLANVELKVPVKSDTKFQSGSMGKQFASMAVMMLVEEGKVHLDDRLTTYFTDAPESWRKITVRQLLTHTSGLANDIPWEDYRSDSTEAQLLIRIEAIPLDFEPGAKWS